MKYYKTRDILHVMQLLGHKNIKNLEGNDSEHISKVARTVKEARLLVEAGFEYVYDMKGVKILRKGK